MAHITKSYNFTNPALYDGTALEAALSAFLALVNGKIDATNMDRGSTAVFDWLNTRLKNLSDPVDLQDAVTLNYITNVITALHTHSNKAILDAILDAGSGSIITAAERAKLAAILDTGDGNIPSAAERARFLTQDQSDAMNAASAPSALNAIATIADVTGAAIKSNVIFKSYSYSNIGASSGRTIDNDILFSSARNSVHISKSDITVSANLGPLSGNATAVISGPILIDIVNQKLYFETEIPLAPNTYYLLKGDYDIYGSGRKAEIWICYTSTSVTFRLVTVAYSMFSENVDVYGMAV